MGDFDSIRYFLIVLVSCIAMPGCRDISLAVHQHSLASPTPTVTPTTVSDEAFCKTSDAVFCSGFEEGNFSVWDDYDGNPAPYNVLLADPGPFNKAGNHVGRLRVPLGRGGADFVKVLPGTYDKLYARWYMQWEPGYSFSAPNHGSGLMAGDRNYLGRSDYRPDGTNYVWTTIEPNEGQLNLYSYYRGMYMDCADPNGACWGDMFPCLADQGQVYCTNPADRPIATPMPPHLQTGKWYCVEMMVDLGSPVSTRAQGDGKMDYWLDGVEYGPWPNLWMRTTSNLKLNILWLSLFHHDSTHTMYGILYDNVVVSKNRIGCATQ